MTSGVFCCAFRISVTAVVGVIICSGTVMADTRKVLTKAEELHRLTPRESSSWVPVKMRGVITYIRGIGPDHIVQDETGGFLIDWTQKPEDRPLKVGMEILIEGHTNINPPTPRVSAKRLQILGEPGLPVARKSTISELLTEPLEASLVEFTARVRSVRKETAASPTRLALDFGPRNSRVNVWISRWNARHMEQFKAGASVRVRGVLLRWKTTDWLPYTTFVVVQEPNWLSILDTPPPPESLPVISIPEAIRTRPKTDPGIPLKIRGVVTFHRPSEGFVLQGDGAAIWVRPAEATSLNPGDLVEAIGFSEANGERKELEDAKVTLIQTGSMPEPVVLAPGSFKNVQPMWMDSHLVRVQGKVQQSSSSIAGTMVWIDIGTETLPLSFPTPDRNPPPLPLAGSVVEATGVLQAHLNLINRRIGWGVSDYEMLLQSPASLTVIRPASWWTRQRLLGMLAIILLLAGGSALWALSLRKRVAEKSAALAREITARHDQDIVAEERQRLARDLHDTIEQTLTGASLQLDAVEATYPGTAPANTGEPLQLARRLLDRSRDELRRAVWDLTPGVLEQYGLPVALQIIAEEQSRGGEVAIEIQCDPEAEKLPDRLAAHLCRVVQEATSNAIRHGRARHVVVTLQLEPPGVTLTITDDGSGFDPGTALGITEGHFGLNGMKERMRRLGGDCEIASRPGAGTILRASCQIEIEPPPGMRDSKSIT